MKTTHCCILFVVLLSLTGSKAVAQPADIDPNAIIGAQKLSDAFRAAAKHVGPSVVTITAMVQPAQRNGRIPEELRGILPDELFIPTPQASSNRVPVKMGVGSGVILTADGFIVTNNHVIADADQLQIRLNDGRVFASRVVGRDPQTDLAVLKINVTGLTPARIGDSEAMYVGDWVIAVGSPFELEQTVTAGIISAVNRSTQTAQEDGILVYEDFLQTDAAINPGNSGGPLVNLRGEVVGINTAINSRSGTNAGVGFAIPSKTLNYVAGDLREIGRVRRGFIGAKLADVEYNRLQKFGLPPEVVDGVLLEYIPSGEPADKAGLQKGDFVVRANGREITSVGSLRSTVALTRPGSPIRIEFYRKGQRKNVSLVVEEMTPEKMASMSDNFNVENLGIVLYNLTPEIVAKVDIDSNIEGVLVLGVIRGSVGQRLGFQAGDVITEVNNKKVSEIRDFVGAFVDKTGKFEFSLVRNGEKLLLNVKVNPDKTEPESPVP